LLAQVKTLEGKLKKICSAKPKPKGCWRLGARVLQATSN
jgi:hypothetical protein